jgi:ubiquinone/menaquinone biosynthesis C-methylase UbiE
MSPSNPAFADKIATILNYGALNLAMAIGYRRGLFDVLDRSDAPASAADIAARAGLDRRYVQEWLAVMVCGGIVELSPSTAAGEERYFLPQAHGDLLARRAGHANLGVYTQEIPLLTVCALSPVVEALGSGAGIGYDRYPEFQGFMSQLANAKHSRVLVEQFLPSIEQGRLVDRLNGGIRLCDLGCGEGVAATLMAEAFPRSTFTGIDIDADALARAMADARRKRLDNVSFIQLDAARLADLPEWHGRFDVVTAFDAIHDQPHPQQALRGVFRMLRPGGLFSMVDIAAHSQLALNRAHPMGAFLYTVSLMHCLPVGLRDGGTGLGMMWGRERAEEMLAAAGFDPIGVHTIPEDAFNLNFLAYRPSDR